MLKLKFAYVARAIVARRAEAVATFQEVRQMLPLARKRLTASLLAGQAMRLMRLSVAGQAHNLR